MLIATSEFYDAVEDEWEHIWYNNNYQSSTVHWGASLFGMICGTISALIAASVGICTMCYMLQPREEPISVPPYDPKYR
eukprot:UN11261